MTEYSKARELINFNFNDLAVSFLDAPEILYRGKNNNRKFGGLSLNDPGNISGIYRSKDFTSALKTSILWGEEYYGERDRGVVKAGYIVDLIHLIKPEYHDQVLEMVHEAGKVLDKEGFIKKANISKKNTTNECLALAFGRAAAATSLYNDVNMPDNLPKMFFNDYLLKFESNQELSKLFFGSWLLPFIELGFLNKDTTISDFAFAAQNNQINDLIALQKSQLGNQKFDNVLN